MSLVNQGIGLLPLTPFQKKAMIFGANALKASKASGFTDWSNSGRNSKNYAKGRSKNKPSSYNPAPPSKGKSSKPARRKPKKKVRVKTEIKKIKKSLTSLRKADDATLGMLIYRKRRYKLQESTPGAQDVVLHDAVNANTMATVLGQLLYFDPNDPQNLIQPGLTGAYSANLNFPYASSKCIIRNNGKLDAHVQCYVCFPRVDTNSDPIADWRTGASNDAGNVSAIATSLGVSVEKVINQKPSDFETFRRFWSTKKLCDQDLAPGRSVSVQHSIKDIQYDQAFDDENEFKYQRGLKSFTFMTIVNGTLCINTDDDVGQGGAQVSTETSSTFKVRYPAGVNTDYVYLDTGATAFGVDEPKQAHQPQAGMMALSFT